MLSFRNCTFLIVVFVLIAAAKAIPVDTKTSQADNQVKAQDAKCLLPKEPGPCRMSLSRFYYNSQTDTCEDFTFGGCKGNDNSFGFKETCEQACKKTVLTSKQLNISTLKSLTQAAVVTEKIEVMPAPVTQKAIVLPAPVTYKAEVTVAKPQVAVKH